VALLAPAVALYSVALTRGRREQAIAAGVAAVTVIAVDTLYASPVSIIQTMGHLTLVAIPLLAAETLRTRRSYVSLLVERLELAERTREQEAQHRAEQERMRIARDLHDIVAHTLTTINVQAATAAQLIDRDPAHALTALRSIEEASRDAIAELRAMVGVLRDGDSGDAPRTPSPNFENVAELVQRMRAEGVEVEIEQRGVQPERLSDAVSLAAYRIVQESLSNARRHATGAAVHIDLQFQSRELFISVENGAGTETQNNHDPSGVGIKGMTERACGVGGSLAAEPLPTRFRVVARLPYALGGP
jgi:signal transduction histidine kinase